MRKAVLKDKSRCCGCGACAAICPHDAISMAPDAEGFLYPRIDPARCVDCGLCERRCPATQAAARGEKPAYAAHVRDEAVRERSSSGGVFTQLARGVLSRGGVVFGAAMDEELRVSHVGAMDETGLAALRGSKYVQSDVEDAYRQAERLLDAGLPVLFTGTPCQVAGLYAALGGDREGLLTADLVCHGAPSPAVFASYVQMLQAERGQRVLMLKPRLDTRDGERTVRSRCGLETDCAFVEELDGIDASAYACLIVDEAQFLTKAQVEQLVRVVDELNLPVIAYGLRADFQGKLFEGSQWLMAWADTIEEVKTICWCGRKATFNARVQDGRVVKQGDQILLGGSEQYVSLCRRHWMQGDLGPFEALHMED